MSESLHQCLKSLPDVLPRAGAALVWRTEGANLHLPIPTVGEEGCAWAFKAVAVLLVSPEVTPDVLASWDEEAQAVVLRGVACYLGVEVDESQTVAALCSALRRARRGEDRLYGATTALQAAHTLNLDIVPSISPVFMRAGALLPSSAFHVPKIVETLAAEVEQAKAWQHSLTKTLEVSAAIARARAHFAKILQPTLLSLSEAMRAVVAEAAQNAAAQQRLQRFAAQSARTLGHSAFEPLLRDGTRAMMRAAQEPMSHAAREALRAAQRQYDFGRFASLARPYLDPPRMRLHSERETPVYLETPPLGKLETPDTAIPPLTPGLLSRYEGVIENPEERALVLFLLQRRAERALRFLVRRRMTARFGSEWWYTKVSREMRDKAEKQYHRQPVRAAESPPDLLDYLDWYDLGVLCLQNWDTVCADVFAWGVTGTRKHFEQMWQESCRLVRNGVDHSRDISPPDFYQCRPFLENIAVRVREAYPDFSG